jgi:hypothetical protein
MKYNGEEIKCKSFAAKDIVKKQNISLGLKMHWEQLHQQQQEPDTLYMNRTFIIILFIICLMVVVGIDLSDKSVMRQKLNNYIVYGSYLTPHHNHRRFNKKITKLHNTIMIIIDHD